jgi:predicted Holliday junction resolvase-like endonuclease
MMNLIWVLLGIIVFLVIWAHRERSKRLDEQIKARSAEYEKLWAEQAKLLKDSRIKANTSREEYEKKRAEFLARVDVSKRPKQGE